MTMTGGRHRISRRTKIATLGAALVVTAGSVVVLTASGGDDAASADGVDKSQFVDITTVQPNVKAVKKQRQASRGTFTVSCGRNENGHFNSDNFIAQPGVAHGAQHLHDYVGNLSTNAESTNQSLLAAGTTCRNGDKSTYFWPVLRIDKGDAEVANPVDPQAQAQQEQQKAADEQIKEEPRVQCPDVASKIDEEVPEEAQPQVDEALAQVEQVTEDAEKRLPGSTAVDAEVLGPLTEQRKQALDRLTQAVAKPGVQPVDFGALAPCAIKQPDQPSPIGDGSENSEKEDPADAQAGAHADHANELPGNLGEIQRPEKVELTFRGSPVGKVRAMPKFLRVLYGDAKVSTNGPANARASWTCTGFEDKVQLQTYVVCPEGSKVKRLHDFPSCWDGRNTDSANHRTHIVYPDPATGKCARGFKAVPQLRISLTYDIPRDVQVNGQYAVDSFPQESHNPFSDHDDFANVMNQRIMNRLVWCVNRGKTCRE
ncbi:DUF1996 domain-containing protein [Saccharothrix longispora]|nr:DUF1996 domain-containing protein [Saccharothrix longispora]MDU0287972.1 DUF1996 domain-containing protein [Saccharothrix longispora]